MADSSKVSTTDQVEDMTNVPESNTFPTNKDIYTNLQDIKEEDEDNDDDVEEEDEEDEEDEEEDGNEEEDEDEDDDDGNVGAAAAAAAAGTTTTTILTSTAATAASKQTPTSITISTKNTKEVKSKKTSTKEKKGGIGLYMRSILTKKVIIPFKLVGSNVGELLIQSLEQELNGKCSEDGYIKKGSIRLIKYSAGSIESDKVVFQVLYECLVCNPVEGFGFKVVVQNITKMGIRATIDDNEESPVVVFLAREHHVGNEEFSKLKQNDIINIKVIGTRFELNDPYISVIAKFDSKRRNVAEISRIARERERIMKSRRQITDKTR